METSQKYNIIFRACDVVLAVNRNPRPFNLNKTELVKICFLSLLESIKGLDYKIIVLGDKLSDDLIKFFGKFDVDLRLGTFGNDASIREALKIASGIADDEWVYLCEDDYLHTPGSFRFVDSFLSKRKELFIQKRKLYNISSFFNLHKKGLFIFPPDYPDRYRPNYRKHSLILASDHCHWRQVTNITFTYLTKASSIKKHLSLMIKCSHKANDGLLSRKLFGRTGFGFSASSVCFSPLPGISSHMHRDTMTPIVNWEELIVYYQNKIRESNY